MESTNQLDLKTQQRLGKDLNNEFSRKAKEVFGKDSVKNAFTALLKCKVQGTKGIRVMLMYDVLYCEMQMRGQFFSKFYTTYFKPK